MNEMHCTNCGSGDVAIEGAAELHARLTEAKAKLSERKTVHEWLNAAGIPREEAGRPLCLLRRLRIACDALPQFRDTEEAEAVAAFLNLRRGMATAAPPGMKFTRMQDGHRCFIEDK